MSEVGGGGASLIDLMTEGVVQLDAEDRVRRANAVARLLLGLPPDAVGRRIGTLIRQPELREVLRCGGRCGPGESCEVTLDGRHLAISARRLDDVPGFDSGTLFLVRDLTEIRRLERVRRDFVANVSHELKTPLTSIRGYTETLLQGDTPPEMERQFLETIERNAHRLQQIIEDLLDLSRLEAGRWQPEIGPVDLGHAAEQAWTGFAERAAEKTIAIRFDVAPAVTAAADSGGLHQVLVNLFDNALRYTPAGGEITVRTGTAGVGRVAIEVGDTGVGIPADALSRIFERFYRVDPARSREDGGTGLGLSIVKHLVESMGGEVAAESELGWGTVIRVTLPAVGLSDAAS